LAGGSKENPRLTSSPLREVTKNPLKTMAIFNKEKLTVDDQDGSVILAAPLGGIWPRTSFTEELSHRTPSTL
jgi:hypothetical protein